MMMWANSIYPLTCLPSFSLTINLNIYNTNYKPPSVHSLSVWMSASQTCYWACLSDPTTSNNVLHHHKELHKRLTQYNDYITSFTQRWLQHRSSELEKERELATFSSTSASASLQRIEFRHAPSCRNQPCAALLRLLISQKSLTALLMNLWLGSSGRGHSLQTKGEIEKNAVFLNVILATSSGVVPWML